MSAGQGGEDQIFSSDEQDQQCIDLRQKISTKQVQLVQIINNRDKFSSKITELANIAKLKIDLNQKQELKFAVVYLKEAEKILQYAASSGKNINKELIITILHNQASIYQKLWELNNCSDYLEGIIYNYDNFIRETSTQGSIISKDTPASTTVDTLDPTRLKMKQKLARYNLQFCAVNSQLSNHDASIQAIKKAHKLLSECFSGTHEEFRAIFAQNFKQDDERVMHCLDLLNGLIAYDRRLQEKIDLSQVNKNLLKSTHFSLQLWQDNKKTVKNISSASIQKYLLEYSIGNIVQIVPIQLDKEEVGFMSMQQNKNKDFENQFHPYNKIILISACFFSRATELRLKSIELFKKNLQQCKFCREYKLSINYHLLAIILTATFIPCEVKYLKEILLSYEKHYAVNLLEYKTVQIESLIKMSETLGITLSELPKNKKYNTQKVQIDESDSKNDYHLKSTFELKSKKLQKMKSLKKITKQLNQPKRLQDKSPVTPSRSKDSKNSFSVSKHEKKNRTHSKNDTAKKQTEYKQVKDNKTSPYFKVMPNGKIKKTNDMMKSRQRDLKKSRNKEIVDETQELFFCFSKKTKKTQGRYDNGSHLRSSSIASNSMSKSKTKKNILSPKNVKLKMNSPVANKLSKSPPKRKNLGDSYYF